METMVITKGLPSEESRRAVVTSCVLDALHMITFLWGRPEHANSPLYADVMRTLSGFTQEDLREFFDEYPKLSLLFAAEQREPSKKYCFSDDGEEESKGD